MASTKCLPPYPHLALLSSNLILNRLTLVLRVYFVCTRHSEPQDFKRHSTLQLFIFQSKCLFNRIHIVRNYLFIGSMNVGVWFLSPTLILGSFKHATFLSHGRQPEVNISHARTVVSPRFSNKSSLLVKRHLTIQMW